jgi:FtsZ-binding cell division protein ZapB
MNEVVELINSVGFPIAMCIALFYMNNGALKTQQQTLTEIQQVVKGNTAALENLTDHIKDKRNV